MYQWFYTRGGSRFCICTLHLLAKSVMIIWVMWYIDVQWTICSELCLCEQLILQDMCLSGGQVSTQLFRLLLLLPSFCEDAMNAMSCGYQDPLKWWPRSHNTRSMGTPCMADHNHRNVVIPWWKWGSPIWLTISPRVWGPSVWQIFNNQPLTDLSIPLLYFGTEKSITVGEH